MSLTGFPLIIHGEVNERYVQYLKPIVQQSGLGMTVHIGTGLDLRSGTEYELHKKVLLSSIENTAALGGQILTWFLLNSPPGGRTLSRDSNRPIGRLPRMRRKKM